MKTLAVLCLFSFASLTFGQKAEKMDRRAAAQAWAAVNFPLPLDTPSITDGGIVMECAANDYSCRAWLSVMPLGTYLIQGNTCDGDQRKLGEFYWEANYPSLPGVSNQPTFGGLIFDSAMQALATPFSSQICSIDVIRLEKGKTEKSTAGVSLWWQSPDATKFQVGSENVADGRYQVSTTILPKDAIVILGRGALGKAEATQFGSVVTFPSGTYLPPVGRLTTLTVCSHGQCTTATFERKKEVPTSGSGKG